MGFTFRNLPVISEGITTIMIQGAIRNELTREDLDGLGNLTKCEEIRLLGRTQIADVFFTPTVSVFF